jgi:hypothetical protein
MTLRRLVVVRFRHQLFAPQSLIPLLDRPIWVPNFVAHIINDISDTVAPRGSGRKKEAKVS